MRNIRIAEIANSFLTWNEGRIKIVHYVTMENISHSKTINKFHKSKGSLTQCCIAILEYRESGKRKRIYKLELALSVYVNPTDLTEPTTPGHLLAWHIFSNDVNGLRLGNAALPLRIRIIIY